MFAFSFFVINRNQKQILIRCFSTDALFQKDIENYRKKMKRWWADPRKKNRRSYSNPWLAFQFRSKPVALFFNRKKTSVAVSQNFSFFMASKFAKKKPRLASFQAVAQIKTRFRRLFIKKQLLYFLFLKRSRRKKNRLAAALIRKGRRIPWKYRPLVSKHKKELAFEKYAKQTWTIFGRRMFFDNKKLKKRRWRTFTMLKFRGPTPRYVSVRNIKRREFTKRFSGLVFKLRWAKFKNLFLRYSAFKFGFSSTQLKRIKAVARHCPYSVEKFISLFESQLLNIMLRARLAPTAPLGLWLIKNRLITVNSNVVTSGTHLLRPYDVIQLNLSALRAINRVIFYFFVKKIIRLRRKFILPKNLPPDAPPPQVFRRSLSFLSPSFDGTSVIFLKQPFLRDLPTITFGLTSKIFYTLLFKFITTRT